MDRIRRFCFSKVITYKYKQRSYWFEIDPPSRSADDEGRLVKLDLTKRVDPHSLVRGLLDPNEDATCDCEATLLFSNDTFSFRDGNVTTRQKQVLKTFEIHILSITYRH